MANRHTNYPFYYYLVLAFFILLSLVFWFFIITKSLKTNQSSANSVHKNVGKIVSDNPQDYISLIGKVEPIDEEKIVIDSANNRNVISNLVNIAIKDKNRNILEFARDFKKEYPSEDYEITYLDSVVNRLQVKLPDNEKEAFKKEVKSKMMNDNLLVWDEAIFSLSNYDFNDPLLKMPDNRWYLDDIQIKNAWIKTKGSPDIVIAVLDNGFDLNHPELSGKSKKGYNTINKNADVRYTSLNHGTHVAATAVGKSDNNTGLLGICPNCSFMPIKVEDDNGFMTSSYIIDGILYAIKNGADVINMSLGAQAPLGTVIDEEIQKRIIKTEGKDEEIFWKELFDFAAEKNVVCVLAAGNNHLMTGLDAFTRSDKTIKVGAIDRSGQLAEFSNFGSLNTIYAPGVDIMSAKPNGNYEKMNGTSMAAPIVSGFIGLIKSTNKNLKNDKVLDILDNNTQIYNQLKTLRVKPLI